MRRSIYSFAITFCIVLLAVSCSEGEHDQEIKNACRACYIICDDIEFVDSIESQATKNIIQQYIDSIDNAIVSIGDSSTVELLCPEASTCKSELADLLCLDDYAYLRYRVYSRAGDKYALVSYRPELIHPTKIVDTNYRPDIECRLKDEEPNLRKLFNQINMLQSKSEEELLQMRTERLRDIEAIHKAEEERAATERKAEEERRNAPTTWDGVAQWMKKKGCSVIGIFKSNGGFGGVLAIYRKGGGTYIASCSLDSSPVDFEYADNLRKVGSNTYQHNEPGSDMPERYTINDGELTTYCYNPDMGEWVNMGSYYQVY